MATHDFDHREATNDGRGLNYKLKGFDPSKHTCGATVSGTELVTHAEMGGKRYEDVIPDADLSSSDVSCKGRKDMVEVRFSKQGYDIRAKLN